MPLLSLLACADADPSLAVDLAIANPQAALLTLSTPEDCRVTAVASLADADLTWRVGPSEGNRHAILVPGLKADRTWSFEAELDCSGVRSTLGPVALTTGPAPPEFPDLACETPLPDRIQPGITLLAPFPTDGSERPAAFFGVDEDCDPVFSYVDPDAAPTGEADARPLPDGTLLLQLRDELRAIDLGGEVVGSWRLPWGYRLHHDGLVLEDGGWIALSTEVRVVETDELGKAALTGDLLLEVGPDGEVRWSWSAFDHLDTDRFPGELSRSTTLNGSIDWTHANALLLLDEETLLLSSRHQHQLYAIDRPTGEIRWTLGDGGDFALLVGEWFYGQHAPEWHEDGELVLYDNGVERPGDAAPWSRAVVVRLDLDRRTAELVDQVPMPAYTPTLGDADLLPGGNLLATAGGPEDPDEPARVLEFTPEGELAWSLELPGWHLYRSRRLARTWLAP